MLLKSVKKAVKVIDEKSLSKIIGGKNGKRSGFLVTGREATVR